MPEHIAVAVVYAGVDQQALVQLDLPVGSTLIQAIEASGLLQRFPEIDLSRNKVGIFGKLGHADSPLRSHDRVEIYRSLIADPKEVRRRRAAEGRITKRDGDGALPQ
ncbi:MAG TPA: RnfH family protein [Rhodocyclaceae bacterium]|nr:RnfH family protein [Rhodocyclaceae bacterium]